MGSCIQVNADGVNAVLNDAGEGFAHTRLRHIVLVLPYADSLWLDLDEFCERILKTAGYRDSASYGNIVLWEFLCGYL